MKKRELYAMAAELFASHDLDGAFGDFSSICEQDDEEVATAVQKEIVAWLRSKGAIRKAHHAH